MIEELKKIFNKYSYFTIILLSVIYFFVLGYLKNGFYVDEIFSYAHANRHCTHHHTGGCGYHEGD